MFDNFLTPEQQAWRDTCNRFMDQEVTREYLLKCDMDRAYYSKAYDDVQRQGWLGLMIPEEDGGIGGDAMDWTLMFEALGKYNVDFAISALGTSMFTAQTVQKRGTPDQRKRFIEPYLKGKVKFCISISEPHAGSDAAAAKTRAERDGDHYVLHGLKQWCSGSSPEGATMLMLVRTDPNAGKREGLTALLVPNNLPGMELRKLKTLARRGTGTNQIFLDGCRVPVANRIGAEGEGWSVISNHLVVERLTICAGYLGGAQQAVTDALRYAHQREQFGQPIFNFQVIKHMLADMQTRVDATRLLVYRAAGLAQAGQDCLREISMAKLYASETLQEIGRQGVQIMGGFGMLPEAGMEHYFREGMQSTVGGGTSQIQRTVIAKTMKI